MKTKLAALARGTRAGATAITGILVVIALGAVGAVTVDYRWLADQRDTMQGAVEAAAISLARDSNEAQNDGNREPWTEEEMIERARAIIVTNLSHLKGRRRQRALDTLTVTVERSFSGPVVFAPTSNASWQY